MPVTITVTRASDVGFTDAEDITFTATLPFQIARDPDKEEDQGKDGDKLYANEMYTFTLVFNEEGVELLGRKCPWEEGGYIVVPIYPFSDPN